MSDQTIKEFTKSQLRDDIPDIHTGQTLAVHQKVKEGSKERIQVFEGLVIATKGKRGIDATFTIRKVSYGVGVEKIFPINSPSIEKIEVLKTSKVRRAKLYYLRRKEIKMKEDKTRQEQAVENMKKIEKARKAKTEAEANAKKEKEQEKAEKEAEAKKAEAKKEEKPKDKKETKSEVNKPESKLSGC